MENNFFFIHIFADLFQNKQNSMIIKTLYCHLLIHGYL